MEKQRNDHEPWIILIILTILIHMVRNSKPNRNVNLNNIANMLYY